MVNTSALLAGALATFSKTAHETLTKVEDQARIEVARALSETRAAQDEHKDAMKMLHAAQMETQELKQQVVTCKAALKQAELTIAHQNELLSQLRRDVTQWKDQSRNWQDHFLRVEQERCALSTRMDELITDRFQEPSSISQYAPKAQYNDVGFPPPPPRPSNPEIGNTQKTPMQRLKPPQPNLPISPSRNGRSIVIRRVNAVVHVKQEDSDNEPSTPVEDTTVVRPRRRSESRRRIKNHDEAAGSGPDELNDDDDELAMGVEVNHHEVYGTQPITATKTPTAPSKKRKLAATSEKSTTRKKLG
ncbi:hypothetical protein BD779DRAFT_1499078 [Infundibulicybe gibba]|nr:hypothetical protein BD779DRAFT_1499078 [Infundibulicybe gibba]